MSVCSRTHVLENNLIWNALVLVIYIYLQNFFSNSAGIRGNGMHTSWSGGGVGRGFLTPTYLEILSLTLPFPYTILQHSLSLLALQLQKLLSKNLQYLPGYVPFFPHHRIIRKGLSGGIIISHFGVPIRIPPLPFNPRTGEGAATLGQSPHDATHPNSEE